MPVYVGVVSPKASCPVKVKLKVVPAVAVDGALKTNVEGWLAFTRMPQMFLSSREPAPVTVLHKVPEPAFVAVTPAKAFCVTEPIGSSG